jgi:hypothetical protein
MHYNTETCDTALLPFSGSRDLVATGSQDKLQFEAVVHMKGASVLNDQYPFGVGVEIDGWRPALYVLESRVSGENH